MKNNKKILIASGGTGGHIFPAIALGDELENQGFEIFYTFDERSKNFVNLQANNISVLDITNNSKSGIINKLKYIFKLCTSIFKAAQIIKKISPAVVIGFGGYATFPVLMASSLLGSSKIIIHESNQVLGKVNQLFTYSADIIATGFKTIEGINDKFKYKVRFTGTPIRKIIAQSKKETKNSNSKKLNILIFGGSQGAKKFTTLIPQAIIKLPQHILENLNIVQQCHHEDLEIISQLYKKHGIKTELQPFFNDMEKRYASADIVIARAGASTISELIELEIPSILIPLANSAKNHQFKNALSLSECLCTLLVEEKNLVASDLADKISYLISNKSLFSENLRQLKQNSLANLSSLIKGLM
jgi:UDP-N-acetylglucosamine--N-acetylmuramyl-(pentapeptide) pyrophosphoryl-undecaprenol N-acetylglucosamine transferase